MEEIKFKLKPRYNFIYEFGMPTGRKVKNAFLSMLAMIIIYIVYNTFNFSDSIPSTSEDSILSAGLDFSKITPYISNILLIFMSVSIVYFLVRLILQILQYNNTIYTFYKDKVIYEDLFLNQQKKSLLYSNIKEIEIRRSIWDRLNRRGIIIIYTNAEKSTGNGLVIYSMKNIKNVYNDVSNLVNDFNHKKTENLNVNSSESYMDKDVTQKNSEVVDNKNYVSTIQSQKEFEESLKN